MPDRIDDYFSPFFVLRQKPGLCGPASLAGSLHLLGLSATQTQVARAAGFSSRNGDGTDEEQLRKAAHRWKLTAVFLRGLTRDDEDAFVSGLEEHLALGLPALLCVTQDEPHDHWVAAMAHFADRDQFIIMDPADEDRPFNRWNRTTLLNHTRAGPANDEMHFAILLTRRDGKPARWRLTEELIRLCVDGADETAEKIVLDLNEVTRRAGASPRARGEPWEQFLREARGQVLDAIGFWVAPDSRAPLVDVEALYDAYVTVAEAANLLLPARADRGRVLVQLATLFTEFARR